MLRLRRLVWEPVIRLGRAAGPAVLTPRSAWITGACLAVALAAPPALAQPVWTPDDAAALGAAGAVDAWVRPDAYSAVRLAPGPLDALLATAPHEGEAAAAVFLALPTPDGGLEHFEIVESPVMHPDLARWFAERGWPLRTWHGRSTDRPGVSARVDWGGPGGFHAMVHGAGERYFVDPHTRGDPTGYVSYFARDLPGETPVCSVAGTPVAPGATPQAGASSGGDLRTFRTAVAATGEYTNFHGGTVADGLAAVVTTINRVTGIYEREFSARLELVANNDQVIYTNALTDPYTNDDATVMLTQNQLNLDSEIGSANYDVGHVVGGPGGSGGVAVLGSLCDDSSKARGATASGSPVGDAFWIDFVAHEIGHQFGGNHTWNGEGGSCAASNFSGSTAYEPGSGSTIMAYAGICGADDLQNNSDPDFHGVSLDEILDCIAGAGACSSQGACSANSAANPNAPTVSAPAAETIPIGTPFELTALNGADLDGGTLTYSWEQFDLGTREAVATGDDGVQPIFRAWPPTTSPTRTFPRLADLLANTTAIGETLPVTNRTLNFRVTIRDNDPAGGRVGEAATTVTATTSAGPFLVTFPNGGEVFLPGAQTVTWDVAGTTGAPVSAAAVDILLSTDGGLSFPTTLASGTANDGSETVTLPATLTTQARIRVQGAGRIFFDLSDADFEIASNFCGNGVVETSEQCDDGNTVAGDGCSASCLEELCFDLFPGDLPKAIPGAGQVASTLSMPASGAISDVDVVEMHGTHTYISDLEFRLVSPAATSVSIIDRECGDFDDFHLSLDDEATTPIPCPPTDAETHLPENPLSTFDGEDAQGVWTLEIEDHAAQDGGSLDAWSLRICMEGCARFDAGDVPLAIPDPGSVTSTLVVPALSAATPLAAIEDLDVAALRGTHPFVSDLRFDLRSPATTQVTVMDGVCADDNDFDLGLDDEAGSPIPCPPTDGLPHTPSAALSAFDGEPLSGSWSLEVEDTVASGSGTLDAWSLQLCPLPEPGTAVGIGAGALLLVGLARRRSRAR